MLVNGADRAMRQTIQLPRTALTEPTEFIDLLGSLPGLVLAPGAPTTIELPPLSAALLLPAQSDCAPSRSTISLPEDP